MKKSYARLQPPETAQLWVIRSMMAKSEKWPGRLRWPPKANSSSHAPKSFEF